ncbi:MAG: glycosyltransferase family 4 protein [Phenylobacterium sp.]
MTNAAIFLHPDAVDTQGPRLLGRHSAGESFLRGFLRHADVDRFHFYARGGSIEQLSALVDRIQPPPRPVSWIIANNIRGLAEVGVLNLPGPDLGNAAWTRRTYGNTAYSICGLTHTTATALVMDLLADYLIAPVEAHDALICTSTAVRDSVEAQLDGVRDYLQAEYGGARRRPEPQRVTIPLGVNTEDFRTTSEQRKAWRERLGIPEDAAVALYVGRFNVGEKMNPALMAIALEKAAEATGQPIYWVNAGWAESEKDGAAYHQGARALCPSVHYIVVDGRPADVRFSIWSVADFFISFSDNIQETFGLTPVEAMAAGLPCVVTDWNGYRDTVRHGEDGFRIPTFAPAPGQGLDLAYSFANNWMSYPTYVGAASQLVAIDYAAATAAISTLVTDVDTRRRLGRQAQAHARATFDWSAIIPQYQALWAELSARRRQTAAEPRNFDNPYRPDPFRLFGGYPTRHLGLDWEVGLPASFDAAAAQARLAGSLAQSNPVNRAAPKEQGALLQWLADRPGATVIELVQMFPENRRSAIARGLLWLARYDAIELRPPGAD